MADGRGDETVGGRLVIVAAGLAVLRGVMGGAGRADGTRRSANTRSGPSGRSRDR